MTDKYTYQCQWFGCVAWGVWMQFLKTQTCLLSLTSTSKKNIRWDCLNSIKDQSKFEDQNSVCINIFGFE